MAKRTPQDAARRTAGVRTKGRTEQSVYTILNGNFRVYFPTGRTTRSRKRMVEAVREVVQRMKD